MRQVLAGIALTVAVGAVIGLGSGLVIARLVTLLVGQR